MFFGKQLGAVAFLFYASCLTATPSSRENGVDTESGCDPLVPEYCMLPFPNDFWRIQDSNGDFHLNFTTNTFPKDDHGKV